MSLWNNEDKADGNISTPEAAVSESTPETWAEEISADDEFDVTDDGIPGHAVIVLIQTAVSVPKEGEDGARNLLFKLGMSVINSPHINPGMNITSTFWRAHTNPKAQQIGRGQFRTLAEAVITKNDEGRTKGNLQGLIGAYVGAWAKQGSSGFPELSRFKTVSQGDLDEAVSGSGMGELS